MFVKGTLSTLKYTLFKLIKTYFSILSPLKSAPVVNNILKMLLQNLNVCILYVEKHLKVLQDIITKLRCIIKS